MLASAFLVSKTMSTHTNNIAVYKQRLKENWPSALTVSLVNIPLSISLAVAANASPVMGIITAFWAGLLAAIFGGSNYNISGPAAALSSILAAYSILYGMSSLPIISIIAGVIVLIAYAFRLDRYIIFIPSSVIHGFTLGVALTLILNQTNFAFGLKGLPVHERWVENMAESIRHLPQASLPIFLIFAMSLLALFLLLKYYKKVPPPIIIAVLGIIGGYLCNNNIVQFTLPTLFTKYGSLNLNLFELPHLSLGLFTRLDLLKAGFTVALVAIIETLLSGKIADGMTKTKFNQRKEMLGLGLGNLFAGFFGGIPATAVLARTALNVKSGANHKTSQGLNSIFVAIIAILLLGAFKYLPLPIIASILVYTAFRMVGHEHFVRLYKHEKVAFGLSLIVGIITVVEDPMIAIFIGSTVSLLIFVNSLSKGQSEITLNKNQKLLGRFNGNNMEDFEKHGADLVVYRLAGQMTYINAQSHVETLAKLSNSVNTVILSLRNLFYVDMDGLEQLDEILENLRRRNIKTYISAAGESILPVLSRSHMFQEMKSRGHVVQGTSKLLEELGFKFSTPQSLPAGK